MPRERESRVCVCVCVRERETERERNSDLYKEVVGNREAATLIIPRYLDKAKHWLCVFV